MEKDKVFSSPLSKKFEFDETVAAVFDDMLDRSVPYYKEVLELVSNLVLAQNDKNLRVLDLGCSTARLLLNLHQKSKFPISLRGVDNSKAMLERAKQKCIAFGAEDIELIESDLRDVDIDDESAVIANYTLQFIRPLERPKIIEKIYRGLKSGGAFYFSEKVVFDEPHLDKAMIDIYYDYKRKQGYSDYEISSKREALENVLIPFTISENIDMCKDAGFNRVDTIFQWANFVTFRALKD